MISIYNIWKLFFITSIYSAYTNWYSKDGTAETCFCKFSGQLDDCCCTIEDAEKLNNIHIYTRINELVKRNYFRYFKLKLQRGCPFWTDWNQCANKDCSVGRCSEEELPVGLKGHRNEHPRNENIYSKEVNNEVDDEPCSVGPEESLGNIDKTISDSQKKSFKDWYDHDSDSSFCEDLEEDGEEAEWVDLLLNPEAYTGYQGEGAWRVWSSIYKENCFLPSKKMSSFDEFKNTFLTKICLEKRVFYRTVSGLHASINVDLSYKYIKDWDGRKGTKKWEPNLDEFLKRFDPERTNGNGPHWLKNLFFTYLLTLRAVTKAAPYWKETMFYTGNTKEDKEVKQIIMELVKTSKTCPSTFDETQMFTGDPAKARELKEEFRLHYKNITRIMDCVGCEKCRLWGKLQTTGIGTAFKILFSSNKWDEIPMIANKRFQLTRTEIVSLFNALHKLSHSVHLVSEFKKMNEKRKK